MDIHVLKMKRIAIGIPAGDSALAVDENIFEIILENKYKPARRRFGIVDLWNIRRKSKRLRNYR